MRRAAFPRKAGRLLLPLALLAGACVGSGRAEAGSDLPLFDAHVHYSSDAWAVLPPESAIAALDRAGVSRALVSSTPDDGTLRLWKAAPDRIVPELRPYRSRGDMGTWTKDPSVLAYVAERLARGIYRGIGEFHLHETQVRDPVLMGFVELAARHKVLLHCHCDEGAIERLATMAGEVRVLWAHAGMDASAEEVDRLLDAHPNLWVELSLRTDVADGGVLAPSWRALFVKHADRFLVGTDTWVNSRWDAMPEILDGVRGWLRQLPPEVAAMIARGNGDRLFPP